MNESMPQLPEYDPHPDLWARIEADLIADEQLGRMVSDLPTHEPKAMLWEAIEQEINANASALIRPLWFQQVTQPVWAGLAVAASFVLVGTWLFLRPETTDNVQVEYTVEQLDTAPKSDPLSIYNQLVNTQRAEAFIARQCAEQQLVCQRPEVHELRDQLTSLIADQQRIEREQQIFGNDPALVRAQVKVTNRRAEVTKELITLLRS